MKKPEQPFKSGKYFSEPEYNTEILFDKIYMHPDVMDYTNLDSDYEDDPDYYPKPSNILPWNYQTIPFTLDDLQKLSVGKDPKEIFVSIDRERHITYVNVKVEHRTKPDLEAWRAGRDAEEVDYQVRLKAYEEELAIYEKWEAEEKIKKLQAKIKKIEAK